MDKIRDNWQEVVTWFYDYLIFLSRCCIWYCVMYIPLYLLSTSNPNWKLTLDREGIITLATIWLIVRRSLFVSSYHSECCFWNEPLIGRHIAHGSKHACCCMLCRAGTSSSRCRSVTFSASSTSLLTVWMSWTWMTANLESSLLSWSSILVNFSSLWCIKLVTMICCISIMGVAILLACRDSLMGIILNKVNEFG